MIVYISWNESESISKFIHFPGFLSDFLALDHLKIDDSFFLALIVMYLPTSVKLSSSRRSRHGLSVVDSFCWPWKLIAIRFHPVVAESRLLLRSRWERRFGRWATVVKCFFSFCQKRGTCNPRLRKFLFCGVTNVSNIKLSFVPKKRSLWHISCCVSMVNRDERTEYKFLERVAFLFLSKTIFFNEFSVAEKRVNLTSGMCYSSSSFVKIIFNERFSDLYPWKWSKW